MRQSGEGVGLKEGYLRYSYRKSMFLLACLLVLLVLTIYTIHLGANSLSVSQIFHYLIFPDDTWNSRTVWDLRLRPILAAIFGGAILGVSGAVMQTILRNPMASPSTLGISNASAFGAAFAIMFLNGGSVTGLTSVTISVDNATTTILCSFAFAMLATGIMLALVKLTDTSPETIVLSGLAISAMFTALMSFVQLMADSTTLSSIVYWQFGTVERVTWDQLKLMIVLFLAAFLYFFYRRWDYNTLESGEEVAGELGVSINRIRYAAMFITSLLTAVCVAFMGVIAFVGLIAPHLVKRFVGNDSRYVIPGSVIIGALIMLVSYVIANYAFGTRIPVGIITSAVGGPVFIGILLARRRPRHA